MATPAFVHTVPANRGPTSLAAREHSVRYCPASSPARGRRSKSLANGKALFFAGAAAEPCFSVTRQLVLQSSAGARRDWCSPVIVASTSQNGQVGGVESITLPFVKMHGIGNDYVYVDATETEYPDEEALAIAVSDRNKGIGGDGLIFIKKSNSGKAKFRMQMHNADGSVSEMCGNGLRCVAKFLFDRRKETDLVFPIETGAGILSVQITPFENRPQEAKFIRVNMGQPILERSKIPVSGGDPTAQVINETIDIDGVSYRFTSVSMGNPHCVIYVDDVENFPVHTVGPKIENHPLFPRRVNVEFIEIVSRTEVKQRTWERGSGETLACGTGASAVCVAGVLTGRTERRIHNTLLGGELDLFWDETDNCVYKTGPATQVFEGIWAPTKSETQARVSAALGA